MIDDLTNKKTLMIGCLSHFPSDYSLTFHLSGWAPGVYASPRHLIGQLSLLWGWLQTDTRTHTHTHTHTNANLSIIHSAVEADSALFLATVHLRELLEVWEKTKSLPALSLFFPLAHTLLYSMLTSIMNEEERSGSQDRRSLGDESFFCVSK